MASAVDIRARFLQGMARIAAFWGFPKAMGAAYAAVYLSPEPVTLDDLVTAVGVTKGALSTHMTQLERLGLVHRDSRPGDRKDYFSADSDFWGVLRGILRERERREFNRALRTVDDCLELLDRAKRSGEDVAVLAFYRERILAMQRFFQGLDRVVGAILAIEDFREAAVGKLLGRTKATRPKKRRES
jgi:HTH-type transcriptional regulator, glycine betaine synthesis regulator